MVADCVLVVKEALYRTAIARRILAILVGAVVFFSLIFLTRSPGLASSGWALPWIVAILFLAGFAAEWSSPSSQSENAGIVGFLAGGWIAYTTRGFEIPEELSEGEVILGTFVVFAGCAIVGGYVARRLRGARDRS